MRDHSVSTFISVKAFNHLRRPWDNDQAVFMVKKTHIFERKSGHLQLSLWRAKQVTKNVAKDYLFKHLSVFM